MLALVIAFLVAMSAALAIIWRRHFHSTGQLPVTSEWIQELSVDRYRPMLRLLDNRDLQFLRSQPGFTGKMEARLRSQRCQVFRGYLKCLEADFQTTCSALKLLMTQSHQDRPDLASALTSAQFSFARGILVMHARLFLYRLGLASVDARGLVKLFDGLRVELRTMLPATATSLA